MPASQAVVRAPEFWAHRGLVPTLLEPLATLYAAAGAARAMLTTPFHAAVPVLCVGNLVAGGAGKTPVVLSLAERLRAAGHRPHIVTRGYGGRLGGPVRADPARHGAAEIGDEALLLARAAPCFVSRDRVAGTKAAIAAGADLVLLDDGFQNPSLAKDLSFIVVDGAYGFGNRRLIPAGPLREPIERGLGRGDAVILIGGGDGGGNDGGGAAAAIAGRLPTLHATLEPQNAAEFAGTKVLAFAGIGRPAKFYATLAGLGAEIVARRDFPDHHRYSEAEIGGLVAAAKTLNARPVTTAKDWVRVPERRRAEIGVLEVAIAWREPERLGELLSRAVATPLPHG
jgi:tetraacyldisaccharide 4'-kinase